MKQTLFHLAFPVNNIPQTKEFYVEGLGCKIGRETPDAIILNFYNHQIVAHVTQEPVTPQKGIYPRHFGLVFIAETDWEALLNRAQEKQLKFYQSSKHRFINTPVEHRTFFLEDPFENRLEFKFYYQTEAIFGSKDYTKIGDRKVD
jgi:uncharacterized protein